MFKKRQRVATASPAAPCPQSIDSPGGPQACVERGMHLVHRYRWPRDAPTATEWDGRNWWVNTQPDR